MPLRMNPSHLSLLELQSPSPQLSKSDILFGSSWLDCSLNTIHCPHNKSEPSPVSQYCSSSLGHHTPASPLANAPVFCPAYIVSDFLVVYGWENDFHDSNPLWADTEVPYSVIYICFSGAQTLAIFMGTLGLGSYTMWYCSKSGPHEHTVLASGTH